MPHHNFVLIHSPLLRNYTWQAVASILRASGHVALTPELTDDSNYPLPYWKQEVDSINFSIDSPIIVGHSGAGVLLPHIGQKLNAKAFIFVDVVLMFEPQSRLDLLYQEGVNFAEEFEAHLKSGGKFPEWTDEQLHSMITDDTIRQSLLTDLNPRGLDFFSEQIEVPNSWTTLPIAYIQLSDSYSFYAKQATEQNWHVVHFPSHHFEMLTNPTRVSQLIINSTESILQN